MSNKMNKTILIVSVCTIVVEVSLCVAFYKTIVDSRIVDSFLGAKTIKFKHDSSLNTIADVSNALFEKAHEEQMIIGYPVSGGISKKLVLLTDYIHWNEIVFFALIGMILFIIVFLFSKRIAKNRMSEKGK